MVGNEAKIKDVCADCNNGVLAGLDAYAKGLFTDSGLLVHNYLKKSLILKYDYSKILRWLLKVSFNTSRMDGLHSHLFEEFVPFILREVPLPPRRKVAVIAYLAGPIKLDDNQAVSKPFFIVAKGEKMLNPFIVRIGYNNVVSGSVRYTLRTVNLGPLAFYLLIFDTDTSPFNAARSIGKLTKKIQGAVELNRNGQFIKLQTGRKTWLELYEDQVLRNGIPQAMKQLSRLR